LRKPKFSMVHFLPRKRGFAFFLVSAFVAMLSLSFGSPLPKAEAQTVGAATNFYVTVNPTVNALSYRGFSPQTMVAQQGSQVNVTVRNLWNQSFHLQIQGQPAVTVAAGTQNGSSVNPTDTTIPLFTASSPGIFGFSAVENPEMSGQLVVLPSDWAAYNPTAQTRSLTQVVTPDFAGEGYDKFLPSIIVVNQDDTVNVTVRNADEMAHGFALPAYGIDAIADSGVIQPNGTIASVDTVVAHFVASSAGIFRFLCTVPCGPGHLEMVGSLVVLPSAGSAYTPEPAPAYGYLTVMQDFAGAGYDKYVPDTVFANQNDMVYIDVRNTDTVAHAFTLPAYNINNVPIPPATGNATSGYTPTDTIVPEFFATQPGIYEFFCSNNCGAGHDQMIGYLVVLTQLGGSATASPSPLSSNSPPQSQMFSPVVFVLLAVSLLVVGILIGIVAVSRWDKTQDAEKDDTQKG
jgi:heme/copper-type cytochrome/quinol oxidase subunit 2